MYVMLTVCVLCCIVLHCNVLYYCIACALCCFVVCLDGLKFDCVRVELNVIVACCVFIILCCIVLHCVVACCGVV